VRLAGMASALAMCQPARSIRTTARASGATARLSSSSITGMAAALTAGRTRATPAARAGQTAPNREAASWRRSRPPRGRLPLWDHRRQTRPGLADPVGAPGRPPRSPLGASRPSRNQTSSRLAAGWSRATSAITAGNFFGSAPGP
jgi:hypothetical protein